MRLLPPDGNQCFRRPEVQAKCFVDIFPVQIRLLRAITALVRTSVLPSSRIRGILHESIGFPMAKWYCLDARGGLQNWTDDAEGIMQLSSRVLCGYDVSLSQLHAHPSIVQKPV